MGSIAKFPPAPSPNIDWEKTGVGITEVHGHVESCYSSKTGRWTAPKFVKSPILGIHGLSPALNYGQQAYEGLKAFRGPSGDIHIFRTPDHGRRLAHSSSYVSIPGPPPAHFTDCVHAAVASNAEFVPPHGTGASLYIRPLIFGLGGQHMGLSPPEDYLFCVFVNPINAYHGGVGPLEVLVLDDFDRAAPRGTGSAKIGGNYAPVMPWSEKARAQGFALTLHLDSQERVAIDEFSSSGFAGVEAIYEETSRYRLVVPDSNNVVKSVTSDTCIKLAQSLGWDVETRKILYSDINKFDEVLAVGTAVGISAVGSITRMSSDDKFVYSKDGLPGPCCLTLLRELQSVQQGVSKDAFGWRDAVKEKAVIRNLD